MKRAIGSAVLMVAVMAAGVGRSPVRAAEVKITPDVVYGHKLGLAMTCDVFRPEQANGAGVLFMVSGGWYSNWQPPEKTQAAFRPLLDRGFTVFAVRHGSSPRFTIPEAVADVRRCVRFVRTNAERFGVDPDRLGVYGASAGGHLSLVLGTESDEGNPKAADPVERASDRVAAVVAYVAPTDLRIMVHDAEGHLPAYDRFPALKLDVQEAAKYSPLLYVSPDDPPTLLIVGDKDELVPMSHSEKLQAAFEKEGVANKLMVLEGAGHGFPPADAKRASEAMVAWFVKYLTPETKK